MTSQGLSEQELGWAERILPCPACFNSGRVEDRYGWPEFCTCPAGQRVQRAEADRVIDGLFAEFDGFDAQADAAFMLSLGLPRAGRWRHRR